MTKKFIKPEPILGLTGVAGFKINEWLKTHPANTNTVSKGKREVIKHIKSFYKKGQDPIYSDWYAGMTTKSNTRLNTHKREKNLTELVHYGKFYLRSMSNARALESIFIREYKMGNHDVSGGIGKNSAYVYVFHYPTARLNGVI